MAEIIKDLGIATAYGLAVSKGYGGTEDEFAALMAAYATVGQTAVESAAAAAQSASDAAGSATAAEQSAASAETSATVANSAKQRANGASLEAGASATYAQQYKAEAEQSATLASSRAQNALASENAAAGSATEAAGSATAAASSATAAAGSATEATAAAAQATQYREAVNLFVAENATDGAGYGIDGKLIETEFAQNNISISGEIPVIPGAQIRINPVLGSQQFANVFHNANSNLVAAYLSNDDNAVLTVPDEARYLACSLRQSDKATFTVTYVHGARIVTDNYDKTAHGEAAFAALENEIAIDTSADGYQAGKLMRVSNGTLADRENGFVSDYIQVKPGHILKFNWWFSVTYGHRFYSDKKGHAAAPAFSASEANMTVTVPENAHYIRVSGMLASVDTYKISQFTPAESDLIDRFDAGLQEANPYKRLTIKRTIDTVQGYNHCAFPDMCFFAGKEIIAYRVSKSHYTPQDEENWGGIMIDTREEDGTYTHTKLLKATDFTGLHGELRDPHVLASRDGQYLLLAGVTTYRENGEDHHENMIACLDSSLNVVDYTINATDDVVFWGNPLLTPTNHIIMAAYQVGTTYIYRSDIAFDGTLSGLTMERAATIMEVNTSSEACLGYFNDSLVVLVRRTAVSSCTMRTSNLEWTDGWTSPKPISPTINIHAPRILPNSTGDYLLFMGAIWRSDTDRYPGIGLLDVGTGKLVSVGNVDPDFPTSYGAYCGFVSRGGSEYDTVYYQESAESKSSLTANTALFFKRFNLRAALPGADYLLPAGMNT